MKKLIQLKSVQTLIFVLFCTLFSTIFTACDLTNGDEPGNPSIYGLWEWNEEPGSYDMLITKDCIAMFPVDELLPYVDASYETLEKAFAPDDEFFVYRYDSVNDLYLLYWSEPTFGDDADAEISFVAGEPLILKLTVTDNTMEAKMYWCNGPLYDGDWKVTREEILSNSIYSSVSSFIDPSEIEFREVRNFTKIK